MKRCVVSRASTARRAMLTGIRKVADRRCILRQPDATQVLGDNPNYGPILLERQLTESTTEPEYNPFADARVGSPVRKNKSFASSYLAEPMTDWIVATSDSTRLFGNSRYVSAKDMNQASFGASFKAGIGSIGASGALGGYFGRSSADDSATTSLKFTKYSLAGYEHLKINDRTVGNFLASLSSNVQKAALDALDRYNTLADFLPDGSTAETAHAQLSNGVQFREALENWSEAVDDFYRHYSEEVVVAIHWGAIGQVTLNITSIAESVSYRYGGEASFSVEGGVFSGSARAAYDGMNSNSNAGISVDVKSVAFGTSVAAAVEKWEAAWGALAQEKLLDDKLVNNAPTLEIPKEYMPKVPALKKAKSLADDIKVKDMKSLKALAQVQAYEAAKKADPDNAPTLAQFLAGADEPAGAQNEEIENRIDPNEDAASTSILDRLGGLFGGGAFVNSVDIAPQMAAIRAHDRVADITPSALQAEPGASDESIANQLAGKFVPIAYAACAWSEIFPWLSRGIYNGLDDIDEAQAMLMWRTVEQDMAALAMLYRSAHDTDLSFDGVESLDQISSSFTAAADKMQDRVNKARKSSGTPDYDTIVREELNGATDNHGRVSGGLSKSALAIYRRWIEVPALRQAELGFGVVAVRNSQTVSLSDISTTAAIRVVEEFHGELRDHRAPWLHWDAGTPPSLSVGHPMFQGEMRKIGYSKDRPNLSGFASFRKILPIINPENGQILGFNEAGLYGIYLYYNETFIGTKSYNYATAKEKHQDSFYYAPHSKTKGVENITSIRVGKTDYDVTGRGKRAYEYSFDAYVFEFDEETGNLVGTLWSNVERTELVPLPISAFNPSDTARWQGGIAGAPNLTSFGDLREGLAAIRSYLDSTTKWSFPEITSKMHTDYLQTGLSDLDVRPRMVSLISLDAERALSPWQVD